ncbi:MAG: hypothetical protein QM736_28440 [Vicinamibacterales bacterium]
MSRTIRVDADVCVHRPGDQRRRLGSIFLGAPPPQGAWGNQPSTTGGEWPHYNGDIRGTRYSPLDQINTTQLQQARSRLAVQDRQLRPAPRVQTRGDTDRWSTGVLYTTAGTRRAVVALDAQHRRSDLDAQRARRETRRRSRRDSSRGVASSYWSDGRGDERIVYVTTGYQLVELECQDRCA